MSRRASRRDDDARSEEAHPGHDVARRLSRLPHVAARHRREAPGAAGPLRPAPVAAHRPEVAHRALRRGPGGGRLLQHPQRPRAARVRKHCTTLVAVGQCAITGGLPAMRNGIPIQELFDTSYAQGPTLDNVLVPNDDELPAILDRVYPCHEIVKVDAFLPGCPPRPELLWRALEALAAGRPIGAIDYRDFKFD
ncbi:MAG: hypothetical protein R2708_06880 [Vicinamibacterales bacterium]